MASLLRMPEVAAGATEAVLAEWLVPENTAFHAGDPIVVVETEKATVEVEAEDDALILRALVEPGSEVEVGSPVALLGEPGEKGADLDALLQQLGVDVRANEATAEHDAVTAAAPVPAVSETLPNGARVFASPLARQLLRRAGLAAQDVTGTGPNGRIVRRDVEQAVASRSESIAPPVAAPATTNARRANGAAYTDTPHSRVRRAVAARLTQSKQTVPHFYLRATCTIDRLLALRAEVNAVAPQRISVNDLVIKAVALAHSRVPEMNVVWTEEATRSYETVEIAVAIASDRGLVTPVLRSVENMPVSAIAAAVRTYVDQANGGTLRQQDLEGGTIGVTNLGMFDVEEFSAIINPPHAAILAVGAGRSEPVAVEGAVEVATRMTVMLSVDHRVVDGALAARWMKEFVQMIEEPIRLLL